MEYIAPHLQKSVPHIGNRIQVLGCISRSPAGFSDVYRGQLHDGSSITKVAVKRMRPLAYKEKTEVKVGLIVHVQPC